MAQRWGSYFLSLKFSRGGIEGFFLFSKHGVRLITAQSGKVVQLETACAQSERFHYNTVYDYYNAVFQIQLRDLKPFVFLMHSTNVHFQPRAGDSKSQICRNTDGVHESSTSIQFTISRLPPGCKSQKHQFIVSVDPDFFGTVLITYSVTVTSRSPPCRIVKLNPRFAEVQQNSTSSQFLILCHPPLSLLLAIFNIEYVLLSLVVGTKLRYLL